MNGLCVPSNFGNLYPDVKHGDLLVNDADEPIAVVVGKDEDKPWTIYGEKIWIAVALAKYRTVGVSWGADGRISEIDKCKMNSVLGSGNTVSDTTTESAMDAFAAEVDRRQKSTAKTDALLKFDPTSPAALACRSVMWGNFAFDLPRIEVLMRVLQRDLFIDAHDSTIKNDADKLFGNWWFTGDRNKGNYVWSSSVANACDASYAVLIMSTGAARSCNGGVSERFNQHAVIPCFEIPAE